ncbi:hypothetical protein B0H19DRAFT_1060076 [Mycena capillaripes]|nr:hypothetical protein B0H19DRAFT_1060076 [Mycena capillaripes]
MTRAEAWKFTGGGRCWGKPAGERVGRMEGGDTARAGVHVRCQTAAKNLTWASHTAQAARVPTQAMGTVLRQQIGRACTSWVKVEVQKGQPLPLPPLTLPLDLGRVVLSQGMGIDLRNLIFETGGTTLPQPLPLPPLTLPLTFGGLPLPLVILPPTTYTQFVKDCVGPGKVCLGACVTPKLSYTELWFRPAFWCPPKDFF